MRKRLQIFCLLLLPCLTLMGILGRGSPAALSTSSNAAIPASADNWGLSFPAEHETPIGNATADFLTQYDAWYVGDTSQKVIYLTFDCGYENGMGVTAGRIREDSIYDFKFIGLAHNTVRGAAGGAILCAEALTDKGYITAK